jgi:hypothetical protein
MSATATGIELRTFTYVDILQPQTASFIATVAQGYLPLEDEASLFVEISPGIAINRITDIALKKTGVMPGMQIVERSFGLLEVHTSDQGEIRAAGQAILDFLGVDESARLKPRVVSSEIITGVDGHQTMLINRLRHGQMILKNQTLWVLEVHPAGYAAIACNEAEKAAEINVLEMLSFGAFGRVYLGGSESSIESAARAAIRVLEGMTGRENK